MLSLKRMATLAIASALGVLAFAIPAQASVKAECQISGSAKTQDKDDPQYGVRLMGGGGKFTFASLQIECNGSEKGVPAVVLLTAEARGFYENIVCGTGKAIGTAIDVLSVTKVGGDPTKGAAYYDALLSDEKFAVEFAGFSGPFYWHDWEKPALNTKMDITTENPDKPRTDKDWEQAGHIALGAPAPQQVEGGKPPVPPNTPPGNCTKAFSATGVIGIDEA
jgi:hypothetical protein